MSTGKRVASLMSCEKETEVTSNQAKSPNQSKNPHCWAARWAMNSTIWDDKPITEATKQLGGQVTIVKVHTSLRYRRDHQMA